MVLVLAGTVPVFVGTYQITLACLHSLVYLWPTASMALATVARWAEPRARLGWLSAPLVYLVGYGPLLCAMSLAGYLRELRHADMSWEKTEKTEKTGKVLG